MYLDVHPGRTASGLRTPSRAGRALALTAALLVPAFAHAGKGKKQETIAEVPAESIEEAPVAAVPTASVDIEDRAGALETQTRKLQTQASFETEWHEYNNLDFRRLDETSDQAILDSDDRGSFAFTGISFDLGYQPDETLRFVLGTSYRGLWGNDQIGATNAFNGFVYFTSLYAEYKPKGKFAPRIRLGRQRFDLGGIGGSREYILSDVLDMLRVDFSLGRFGELIVIPINVVGVSAENDDITFVSYLGQSRDQIFGFRGDKMTRRHGGVLVLHPIRQPLELRAYAFYTDIGALGTGSDISYNGELGNFADNDWVFNYGARAQFTIVDRFTPWFSFDGSYGIDRKELVALDVDTNGFALSGGVTVKVGDRDLGVTADVSYFQATGPAYADNGMQFSHGYVGMKARQAGGLMANRFLGWHPTAYVGSYGISDTPQDTERKAGTRVIAASARIDIPSPVYINLGAWYFQDMGVSFLSSSSLDTITPPYGYSRQEFAAETRLGKALGTEVSGNVGANIGDHIDIYAQGGVFLPGAFYQEEIARVAGTALGSTDPVPFWNAGAGAQVKF